MCAVEEVYVAVGTNQTSDALVVYEEQNAFAVASDSEIVCVRVESNLLHARRKIAPRRHAKTIKHLAKCRRTNNNFEYFVTGGADGRVVLWKSEKERELVSIYSTATSKSVVGVVGGYVNGKDVKLISSAVMGASSEIKIHHLAMEDIGASSAELTREQLIVLPRNAFALSVDFSSFKGCDLLAIGTSNRTIEFLAYDRQEYIHCLSIPAHGDWVDSLSFKDFDTYSLLASSSQDKLIKLWRIQEEEKTDDEEELTVTRNKFSALNAHGDTVTLCLQVEAVLNGHDDWIHSVSWDSKGKRLISASSDKTLIIWNEDSESGVWMDVVRLGLVGGQAAGFYTAHFSTDQLHIYASTYYGGVHAWRVDDQDPLQWNALAVPGNGHPSPVRDVSWEPTVGAYLISVGDDQTTRIHAPLKDTSNWIEIARPQVHGHDLQCVATIDPARFVSGAEEKIFRAFNAPETFVDTLQILSGIDKDLFSGCQLSGFGAKVPALGLSNKAIEDSTAVGIENLALDDEQTHWEENAFVANPASLNDAPTEDILMQNTLWPEIHKLYGHGYEVYAIAVSPNKKLLATSCKASDPEHSSIILWSSEDWTQRGQTQDGHQLTVTQIEWSPNGKLLLSVSRDRTAIVYKEINDDVNGFSWKAVWRSNKEHTRIIWSCAWASDSLHFLTSSRDQKLIMWRWEDDKAVVEMSCKLNQPITAVAISQEKNLKNSVIVVGMQDGRLSLLSIDQETKQFIGNAEIGAERISGIDSAISRIRFRPRTSDEVESMFAVAGHDFKVRIYKILR